MGCQIKRWKVKSKKLSFWKRLRVGLELGYRAFCKGFNAGKDFYMMKGDRLSVTYTLEIK